MSKGFVIGFLVGLSLLAVFGTGLSGSKQKDIELQKYQAEFAHATPVQLNVMTPKQRLHSRIHNGAGMKVGGRTISGWLASYRGQRIVLATDILGRRFLTSAEPEPPEDCLARFAKESDAVIRGKVTSKVSQITEDDSFLFTDYDVVVLEVFKNNAANPLDPGAEITFTSLGGEIVVDEVIIKAGGNGIPLLPISTKDVLLFMKFVPETSSYKLTQYDGSFELDGTSARPLAGGFPLAQDVYRNQSGFLKMLRAVSNK
ncbi:MAG TPA: hypothetical protein VFF31_15650 [Blastocatellia bacterium]|nr:hypothetical protein [Blastocatellia bacterium]